MIRGETNMIKILIVEDEKPINDLIEMNLSEAGYECVCAYDGITASDYLEAQQFDLVLLDIMLPGIDGITILKTLRENHNNVPVIFLTAKDDVSDKITGLDAGADDYLTKPFSSDELLARVRALSRRKGELKEDAVTFGDLTLNKKNCELQSAKGEAIKLSLKEYQILDLLFENPHQIITKEQLIEKIWGGESNAEYNNVEVYISFIRKKIENLKVGIRIRTARGIGYSLEDETR